MTELGIGLVAVMGAALVLMLIVRRELAPAGGVGGRGQWWLAAGLGAGVVAFVFKLLLLVAGEVIPPSWLHHTLAAQPFDHLTAIPDAATRSDRQIPTHYRWAALPAAAPTPSGHPDSPAKVALGRRLFHDKNLSQDRSVSCASCHDLRDHAGADARPQARGIHGQVGGRNTPTVWNAAFQARQFWDGRAGSLEEQAKGPLVNPKEMGLTDLSRAEDRVRQEPTYRPLFASAFGGDDRIDIDSIVAALAAFERTLITPDTPFDRYVKGDRLAMSTRQIRGMALFESLGCVQCHSGPNFSAASIFDPTAPYRAFPALSPSGVAALDQNPDKGRSTAQGGPGVWRVPSLRNVARTAPYFHDGSVDRLSDAVRVMIRSQLGLLLQNERPEVRSTDVISEVQAVVLLPRKVVTDAEVEDVVSFLHALSADVASMQKAAAPH